MAMGTTFRYGAMSNLPTVTLANHTSILTGATPGHHGILHNAWYDRTLGRQIITNSAATWAGARDWLWPTVETVHEAVRRADGGAYTVSINEPCDRGASWSTFDDMRAGSSTRPDLPAELPFATERFVRPYKDYRWSSKVDHLGMQDAVRIWSSDGPKPAFMWCNFTLTDAAFHEGGPHSEIAYASVADTDARLGAILDAIEAAGALDQTAFVLVADHGMEEANTTCTGDWDVALRDAGLNFRDEAYGFLYFDV
jgi:predicted AlkP superfamily pyrophosphatase or phosphodiesterase